MLTCKRHPRLSLVIIVLFFGFTIYLGLRLRLQASTPSINPTTAKAQQHDDSAPRSKPLTWDPPPIEDPFPQLSSGRPPSIPLWNKPVNYSVYGLDYAPPLLISFTRAWPMLLQTVTSYITAGWPPSQIYVIENTGVQLANVKRQLTLQNPFFLDYNQLGELGVNVLHTPVMLSFAQLQNYFMHLAIERHWPYYFWSHSDVLALSDESSLGSPEYKSLYERSLAILQRGRAETGAGQRWAHVFFAYDHMTLVNLAAYEDVGGWDTLIPYYMTDCDMHSRLLMANWTQGDEDVGIITDVSTVLADLRPLYRVSGVEVSIKDLNPPPPSTESPEPAEEDMTARAKLDAIVTNTTDLEYFHLLRETANAMFHHKHGSRGRNTWQLAQRGGEGEPYHYHWRGSAKGIEILTEAGKEVFRQKWGRGDCDLIDGGKLRLADQWRIEVH